MRYQILDYRRNLARNKRVLMEDSLFEALMDHMQSTHVGNHPPLVVVIGMDI